MKKLLLTLTLSALGTLAAAQGKDLKVAIDPTYEPFTFKTADGKPTGFDVDIANALCEQIKRKCVFVEQVWDSMIPGLQAKKYDVIISSMSITADRLKAIDFTDKYYNTPSRVVLKKDVKYTGPASIKGKKLGVLKGSTQEKYAMGELKPAGVEIVAGPELYIEKYFGIGAGIGLRKGETALKTELNGAIKTIRGNGVYKKINDKYFKFDVYGK